MTAQYCVLLCSHDGAAHLAEQLRSLSAQTVHPALVLLFDDNSSDGTLDIALRERGSLPLTLVQLTKRAPGAAGAFAALLQFALEEAPAFPYYFLCDQDDRWRPSKAESLLRLLAESPNALPALAHSELLCFGDADLAGRLVHERLRHDRVDSSADTPLVSLAFENVVVGASAAFNRALLAHAVPVPDTAHMHDWWLALACVASGGSISYTSEVLTDYRIHERSLTGRTGRVGPALRSRFHSLSSGWKDPWLAQVLMQLERLPLDGPGRCSDRLGRPYALGRRLISASWFGSRFRAWLGLASRPIWSSRLKDTYYKARLLTDVVVPGYRSMHCV